MGRRSVAQTGKWRGRWVRWAVMAPFAALVALAGPVSPSARAETYYVAPDGDDSGDGRTEATAMRSFERALENLRPGDTLALLDGTYTFDENGPLTADCARGVANGSSDAWITVRAVHERQAWIKGDGTKIPVQVRGCRFWRLEGLRVSSADQPKGATHNVLFVGASDVEARRLLVHDVNRYVNSGGIGANRSQRALIEECEVYFFHRHGVSIWKSDNITVRRTYIDARSAADIPGGFASHDCCRDGGDDGVSLYFSSNSLVENTITVDSEGVFNISGESTASGNPGGQNNRFRGNISYRDLRLGGVFSQSRNLDGDSQPVAGIDIRDLLVIGGAEAVPANLRGGDVTLQNATFFGTLGAAIDVLYKPQGHFAACDPWACAYVIKDSLFASIPVPPLNLKGQPVNMSLRLDNDVAVTGAATNGADAALPATEGRLKDVAEGDIVSALRRCPIVPPAGVPTGANGRPIGATIIKRTVDGVETAEPLWDPATGAFPCGAVIAGVNDVPGASCFDIHKRLNISPNTCPLR